MKTILQSAVILSALFFLAMPAQAAAPVASGVGLTIYNDNFAVIRDNREINFDNGLNTIKFTEVASAIDPTTTKFKCLTTPGKINILEQNYEYDLVNKSALLKRYIDKPITLTVKGSGSDPTRQIQGILSAYIGSSLIIKTGNQMQIVSDTMIESVLLSKAPEDLVTKPTLVWLADSKVTGSQLCQITYTTNAISWKSDYTVVLSADDNSIDFSGWVTIDNKSGAAYKDALIKLMAGDVRRNIRPRFDNRVRYKEMAMAVDTAGFEEKAFAEYHLYTLSRAATINNNQIKQIEFITPASDVPADKVFIYNRSQNNRKVQVKIEFENLEENNLGIALPKGRVRVFKADPDDGTLEFIGEDNIDHTPRKEKLSLYIGNAFDIVPEYKLLESENGPRRGQYHWRKQKHQVQIRNRKDKDIVVYVDESFGSWPNWTIDQANFPYEKKDARSVRFKVNIKADSTADLVYTSTERW